MHEIDDSQQQHPFSQPANGTGPKFEDPHQPNAERAVIGMVDLTADEEDEQPAAVAQPQQAQTPPTPNGAAGQQAAAQTHSLLPDQPTGQ
eukprot:jgi/Chrzof1/9484/Cz04g04230.t1